MREFGSSYIPGVMGPANPENALRTQEKADKPPVVEVVSPLSNSGENFSAGGHDLRGGYVGNLQKKGNV